MSIFFAFLTILGSPEYTPSTSVKISHLSAFKEQAIATAVVSEPPLPIEVIFPSVFMPWNPARTTTSYLTKYFRILSECIFNI